MSNETHPHDRADDGQGGGSEGGHNPDPRHFGGSGEGAGPVIAGLRPRMLNEGFRNELEKHGLNRDQINEVSDYGVIESVKGVTSDPDGSKTVVVLFSHTNNGRREEKTFEFSAN